MTSKKTPVTGLKDGAPNEHSPAKTAPESSPAAEKPAEGPKGASTPEERRRSERRLRRLGKGKPASSSS